jgi:hypothetical protein
MEMKTIAGNDFVGAAHISEIAGYDKAFILLTIIASIMTFSFVFKGFATGDSIYYAHGIEAIWKNGLKELPNNFNGETAFGYYLLLALLYGIVHSHFALSAMMNYFNALASIVMIGFSYFFILSLGFNKRVALFTCFTVLIAPAIWLLSHYGHPAMPCLACFMGSLLIWANLDLHNLSNPSQVTKLLLFTLCAYVALIMRLDILLSFGAYFGILYYQKRFNTFNILGLLIILLVILSLVLLSRHYFLGYVINPTGGTWAYHFGHKLNGAYIPREILKNLAYGVLGVSPFILVIALLGLISFGITSPLTGLWFSWVIPYVVFLPFHNVDFARLTAPTILVFSLLAIACLDQKFSSARQKTAAMAVALIVAQIVSVGLYYPLAASYPFRLKFAGRSLSLVPMGFLITDHNYRQKAALSRAKVAEHIAHDRNGNILIVDFASSTCYYDYFIRKYRDIVKLTDNSIVTKENTFYFVMPDLDISINHPISRLLHSSDVSIDKIHVPPFAAEYPIDPNKLYLEKSDVAPLLQYEVSMMEMRRKIISK